MRKGSLFKLMHDCEARMFHRQRPSQSLPNSPKSPAQPRSQPPAPPPVATSQSVQSGFYDRGEPISLSVSRHSNDKLHSGMHSALDYDPWVEAAAYEPDESAQPFYVEPFETEADDTAIASPEPESVEAVIDVPATSPMSPDHDTATKPTASPSPQAKTEPTETLKPTPTEVMPAEEDEFEADLREILAGKKRYDAQQGRAVPAGAAAGQPAQAPQTKPAETQTPKQDHAIFDRIAQSMKLANAYDLGSIALEQRFDAFDQEEDEREKKPR